VILQKERKRKWEGAVLAIKEIGNKPMMEACKNKPSFLFVIHHLFISLLLTEVCLM